MTSSVRNEPPAIIKLIRTIHAEESERLRKTRSGRRILARDAEIAELYVAQNSPSIPMIPGHFTAYEDFQTEQKRLRTNSPGGKPRGPAPGELTFAQANQPRHISPTIEESLIAPSFDPVKEDEHYNIISERRQQELDKRAQTTLQVGIDDSSDSLFTKVLGIFAGKPLSDEERQAHDRAVVERVREKMRLKAEKARAKTKAITYAALDATTGKVFERHRHNVQVQPSILEQVATASSRILSAATQAVSENYKTIQTQARKVLSKEISLTPVLNAVQTAYVQLQELIPKRIKTQPITIGEPLEPGKIEQVISRYAEITKPVDVPVHVVKTKRSAIHSAVSISEEPSERKTRFSIAQAEHTPSYAANLGEKIAKQNMNTVAAAAHKARHAELTNMFEQYATAQEAAYKTREAFAQQISLLATYNTEQSQKLETAINRWNHRNQEKGITLNTISAEYGVSKEEFKTMLSEKREKRVFAAKELYEEMQTVNTERAQKFLSKGSIYSAIAHLTGVSVSTARRYATEKQ